MANNKGFPTWLGWLLVIGVIAIVYFAFFAEPRGEGTEIVITDVAGDFAEEGGFIDGIWDPDTGQCLPPPGREGMVLARCCFERQPDGTMENIPCKDTNLQSFWLSGEFHTDDYCEQYGISFRNVGEISIGSAWVSSVTISAQEVDSGNIVTVPTVLDNAWNYLEYGEGHYGKVLNIAPAQIKPYGSTDPINFICYGDWAPEDESRYTVTAIASYTVGTETGSSQGSIAFNVDHISVGLEVEIS